MEEKTIEETVEITEPVAEKIVYIEKQPEKNKKRQLTKKQLEALAKARLTKQLKKKERLSKSVQDNVITPSETTQNINFLVAMCGLSALGLGLLYYNREQLKLPESVRNLIPKQKETPVVPHTPTPTPAPAPLVVEEEKSSETDRFFQDSITI